MGAIRTFRLIPPTWATEGMPPSRTQRWRKSLAPQAQEVTRVIDETRPIPAGEDWEIVQRALAGDSDALTTLFGRERVRLYRTAFSLLRNKEDAEDALHEGLLSAYVNLGSFEGRSRFSTWLTRIVLNAALMNLRRRPALPTISLDEIVGNNARPWPARAVDAGPDPEQIYAQVETRDLVEKEMSQLSPLHRSALQLCDIEDLSIAEAAKIAGVKITTLKSRTLRARRQLASLLAAKGVNLWRSYFRPYSDSSQGALRRHQKGGDQSHIS